MMSAIVLYFSMAFIELRIKGDYKHTDVVTDSAALPAFNHLVLKGLDQRIYLEFAANPGIETTARRENALSGLHYEIQGDTLVLDDLGLSADDQGAFTVHVTNSLRSIASVSSYYSIGNLRLDSLTIYQSGGRVWINQMSDMDQLVLKVADGAEFDTFEGSIKHLKLSIDDGNVELRSPVGVLTGSMENGAYLSVPSVSDFHFKKDDSSSMRMYQ